MKALATLVAIAEEISRDVAFTDRCVGVGWTDRHLDQGRVLLQRRDIDAVVMAYQTDAGVVVMREVRAGDVDVLASIDAVITRAIPQALDLGCGQGVSS